MDAIYQRIIKLCGLYESVFTAFAKLYKKNFIKYM